MTLSCTQNSVTSINITFMSLVDSLLMLSLTHANVKHGYSHVQMQYW